MPSPLLPIEQVEHVLVESLGDLGAVGGAVGGGIGGGWAGRLSGASGGRTGGRAGARYLTRMDGDQRTLHIDRSEALLHAVRVGFFAGRAQERRGALPGASADAVQMVGVVGSGALSMNPCVVQLVWFPHELHATAHAREGLIKQRTCAKALERLASTLGLPA
ncbi:hypothetical protein [Blastococcus sp. Marseille-P5729]|uniref:hypothetical protein n=1 Tax=Blastococcus sp. Marseille-P5729 TaxID=2086582 RepID=UPI0018FEE3DD|nr:hypothetical protein [Blastococcus sp. Marseille-P5729]